MAVPHDLDRSLPFSQTNYLSYLDAVSQSKGSFNPTKWMLWYALELSSKGKRCILSTYVKYVSNMVFLPHPLVRVRWLILLLPFVACVHRGDGLTSWLGCDSGYVWADAAVFPCLSIDAMLYRCLFSAPLPSSWRRCDPYVGIMRVTLDERVPVLFGVLTVLDEKHVSDLSLAVSLLHVLSTEVATTNSVIVFHSNWCVQLP